MRQGAVHHSLKVCEQQFIQLFVRLVFILAAILLIVHTRDIFGVMNSYASLTDIGTGGDVGCVCNAGYLDFWRNKS